MGKLTDKVFLFFIVIFAAVGMTGGARLPAVIFASVMMISVESYLWDKGGNFRYPAIALDVIGAVLIFAEPSMMILLPFIAYDTVLSLTEGEDKKILFTTVTGGAFLAGLIALVSGMNGDDYSLRTGAFVLIVSVIAAIRSFMTSKHDLLARDYYRMQDTFEVSRDLLNRRNSEIIEEREKEIHMGTLAERNRIAREIHDNVGHMLSRAILMVGAMKAVHKEDDISGELNTLQETLDSAMTNIRKSVHDIRDDSVDLEGSIRAMTEPLRAKFEIRLDIDSGDDMPGKIRYAIVAICKECISNITKYSQNDTVAVTVNTHPAFYQLEVHDFMASGKSHPVDMGKVNSSTGMGVAGITRRAEELGGRVNISANNGFRVFVVLPHNDQDR